MKIVIAPDSFKESLDALGVARAIEKGFREIFPHSQYDLVPMADGGEGTVEAMVQATSGTFLTRTVTGPMSSPVEAKFGILGDGETAVIEMAAASGLPLVRAGQRNPMNATTYGTGELIRYSLDEGVRKIIIGIGGSATVEGGVGAMAALGVKFIDAEGKAIELNGRGLGKLHRIDVSSIDPRVLKTEILVASDVSNPLTGLDGAANVFGPQKGASPEMVQVLERNLTHYANVVREQLKVDLEGFPGAGAAGGLGFGLMVFCQAKLQSGSELVAKTVKLPERLTSASLCITGEGKIDGQSVHGKVCHRVAEMARDKNVPAIAIVGSIGRGAERNIPPLDAYFAITNRPMELEEAIDQADELLTEQARNVARIFSLARG